MIPDTETNIALGLLVVFLGLYLYDKYRKRFLIWKKFTDGYKKELNDVLTKDEYRVKGRYE